MSATTEIIENGEGGPQNCIICSEEANTKILKDENFIKMLQLFWSIINADVKIETISKSKLREVRIKTLHKHVEGIFSWQKKGIKLFPFQEAVIKEWGTKLPQLEPEEDEKNKEKSILERIQVTHNRVDEWMKECNDDKKDEDVKNKNTSPSKRASNVRDGSQNQKPLKKVKTDKDVDKTSPQSEPTLKIGISTVPTSKSTQCGICLDIFPSYSQLSKHKHNIPESDGKFECKNCYEVYEQRDKLKFLEHKKHCSVSYD